MKFNWGWGVVIFMAAFIGYILSMVFQAHQIETDLYAEDYYDQELAFQSSMNAKSNGLQYKDSIAISKIKEGLKIDLPSAMINNASAKLHLYRPNDADLDLKYSTPKNDFLLVLDNKLQSGNYKLTLEWEKDNKTYLVKKDIYY